MHRSIPSSHLISRNNIALNNIYKKHGLNLFPQFQNDEVLTINYSVETIRGSEYDLQTYLVYLHLHQNVML